jgi:hypothetical protein
MKFAPIVPIPMLGSIKDWDYHMVLAGKCYMWQYRDFYAMEGGYKILDNGAAEREPVEEDYLIDLAGRIGADEVVAPDVMHDCSESVLRLKRFHRKAPQLKLMAVLQATTWSEFEYSVYEALSCGVMSVALPKLLNSHLGPLARLAAADEIRKVDPHIPIHCLGCSKRLSEARDLARQGIVRGIDSSAPVVLGLQGRAIRHTHYDWEASHSALPSFWNAQTNDYVEENLELFRSWCETK